MEPNIHTDGSGAPDVDEHDLRRERLLSQISGRDRTAVRTRTSVRRSFPVHALREAGINAMGSVGVGSFVFLAVQALDLQQIPITPLSVVTLFVMSALIGVLSLLFNLQLPYGATLLMHCLLTFGLVTGWLLINRWFVVFSGHFAGFAALFAVIYILIWVGVVLHGWLLTERLNASLRRRRQRDDNEKVDD